MLWDAATTDLEAPEKAFASKVVVEDEQRDRGLLLS